MAITFQNLESKYNLREKRRHRRWILAVLQLHQRIPGEITFVLTTNDRIRSMNREYLNHNHYTDVITFDYSEGDPVTGDIVVSTDQVKMNAVEYRVGTMDELRRVMVHGLLHLLGFSDHTETERRIMREKENEALHLWLKEG